jgi:hypothetical protein
VDDIGLDNFIGTLGWHWLSVDAVTIVIIQDEDLGATTTVLEGKDAIMINIDVTALGWA